MPRESFKTQWGGMPHSLEVQDAGRGASGEIIVIKDGGTQKLSFFIQGATVPQFKAAWEAQNSDWVELWRSPESEKVFRATRVVRCEQWELTWEVVHYNSKPYDSVVVVLL